MALKYPKKVNDLKYINSYLQGSLQVPNYNKTTYGPNAHFQFSGVAASVKKKHSEWKKNFENVFRFGGIQKLIVTN